MGQNGSSTGEHGISSVSRTDGSNTIDEISRGLYDRQLLKRCEHIPFDVEAWYSILQSQTFYTEFIPISPSIARAFVNFYQTRYNSKQLLNSADLSSIQTIQQELKEKIFQSSSNRFHVDGCFIRLSSRSPKDGTPLDPHVLPRLYHEQLNKLQAAHPDEYGSAENRANMQLIAYSNAQFYTLKVTNEVEAMNLILSSERVFIDLLRALDCQHVLDNVANNTHHIKLYDWNDSIIIRQWNSSLRPAMEFRCFVYQSKLTAISQYNQYCRFYHLQDGSLLQRIKVAIVEYWQRKVQPLLGPCNDTYMNYVVDIGLLESEGSNEFDCIVIELNPFASTTGGSLFDWKVDHDQLTGLSEGIAIRVRSENLPNIHDYAEFIMGENHLDTDGDPLSPRKDGDDASYVDFLSKTKLAT